MVHPQSKEEKAAYLNSLSKNELVELMMKLDKTSEQDDENKVSGKAKKKPSRPKDHSSSRDESNKWEQPSHEISGTQW